MEFSKEINDLIDSHKPSDEELERWAKMTEREKLEEECRRMNKGTPILDAKEYDCKKCNNTGIIYKVKDYEYEVNGQKISGTSIVGKMCDCWDFRKYLKLLRESGIEDYVKEKDFDFYQTNTDWQKSIKAKALKFLESQEAHTFYIGGMTGAGKTFICTAMVKKLLAQKKPARYIKWLDFVGELKGNLNESESKLKEVQNVEVLYIDDLYKYLPSEYEQRVFYQIIDSRHQKKLVTIISSELKFTNSPNTKEEFVKPSLMSIDGATAGRIYEGANGGEFVINLPNRTEFNYRMNNLTK